MRDVRRGGFARRSSIGADWHTGLSSPAYPKSLPVGILPRSRRSLRRRVHDLRLLVKNNTRKRIELADPGRTIENRLGMSVAGVPALHDTGRAEIDVLCVILAIELRRQEAHDM